MYGNVFPGLMEYSIEDSIGYLVNVLAREMSYALNARLLDHGSTIGQFPVLASLWCDDGQTIRDLARSARTSEPTMVRTIDRMQRDGLVTRETGETDRRTVHVRLTDRGHALRDVLIPEAREIVDIAIAGIDADRIGAFEAVAWQMLENLDDWTGTTRSCGRLKREPETD